MKLSIITICYNDKAGLEKTLQSVDSQSFRDFEYIVVDGGSSDGSKEFIEKNSDKISKWTSEKDNGIYDAQNKGIHMAEGEYCLILNSGDLLSDAKILSKVFEHLKPGIGIAYGDISLADSKEAYATKSHPASMSSFYLMREVVAHQSQFIRRELFEEFGGYDLSYKITADYEFFARMFWKHHISVQHLPFVIGIYDTGGISAQAEQVQTIQKERRAIHKKYAPFYWFAIYYLYARFNRLINR